MCHFRRPEPHLGFADDIMKREIFAILAVFCCVTVFAFSVNVAAQEKDGATQKDILSGILEAKRRSGGPIILTPNDLALLSKSELDSILGGSACSTASPITYGQTVNGSLSSQDCELEDGTYADFYRFSGTIGDRITIDLTSTAFDAYLGLAEESGSWVLEDDDGGGGTNSRIVATLPITGSYIILANSVFPDSFGAYALTLVKAPDCTYSLVPTSANVPPEGGSFTFDVVTQPGCNWYSASNSTPHLIVDPNNGNGSGPGPKTVTYQVAPNDTGNVFTGTVSVAGLTFTVTQQPIDCTVSLSPTSVELPGAETSGQFTVNAPAGCSWTAVNNHFFIWIDGGSSGTGSGVVQYRAMANNSAEERTGTVTVRGQVFTITQAGLNCTYSVSPKHVFATAAQTTGSLTVNTQPGCSWGLGSNYIVSFENVPQVGPKSINYTINANPNPGRRSINVNFIGGGPPAVPILFSQAGTKREPLFDFDGDGKADVSVRRPDNDTWYLQMGTAGYSAMKWGLAGDRLVPADYDGDGKTDVAVFRPSNGTWYIYMSGEQTFRTFGWGIEGDIPVPTDRDGDGRADLVVYRPSTRTWYSNSTVSGPFHQMEFGIEGDRPMLGDFDGDGKGDIAMYRPSNNNWYIIKSSLGFFIQTWGEEGDIPMTGDFDGDGATDQAVFRPSTGQWYLSMTTNGFSSQVWGEEGDIPIPADYDGDGKTDVAVYRPSNSTWYIVNSTAGILVRQFGQTGDVPVQSSYNN